MLLFDLSASVMDAHLLDWVVYRDVFIRPLPSARIGVYGFSDTPSRFSEPTVDAGQLRDAIGRVIRSNENRAQAASTVPLSLPPKRSATPGWKSWILEAVLATAREVSTPGATRLIVLLTDGRPSTTTTENDVATEIQSLGVSVFPLFVNDRERTHSVPLASVARLAELTGGRSFAPAIFSEDAVRTVLQIVSESIRD